MQTPPSDTDPRPSRSRPKLPRRAAASMRFPVFANDLGRALPTEIDIEGIEQLDYLLVATCLIGFQLLLRNALQKTAAGFAICLRMGIDTLEKCIRNRDQDLRHQASISGMSS